MTIRDDVEAIRGGEWVALQAATRATSAARPEFGALVDALETAYLDYEDAGAFHDDVAKAVWVAARTAVEAAFVALELDLAASDDRVTALEAKLAEADGAIAYRHDVDRRATASDITPPCICVVCQRHRARIAADPRSLAPGVTEP